MWNSYYALKEALKSQKPQLIILEGYMVTGTQEFLDDSRIIKNNYGLRWSGNKIDSIKTSAPKERWGEFLLEYTQYHTRYSELSKADFLEDQGNPLYRNWKGFGCNMVTASFKVEDVTGVNERADLYEKTEKYYRMIIELAQAQDIPILIVISPYAGISSHDQQMFNTAGDIAKEYGVPFMNYNLLTEDVGLDFSTDAADAGHLNYKGNQKYSLAVGKYIRENYLISDHRGNSDYLTWQEDADMISAMIENQILTETEDKQEIAKKLLNPNYVLMISIDGNCPQDEPVLCDFLALSGILPEGQYNGIYYKDNEQDFLNHIEDEEERYVDLDIHNMYLQRSLNESGTAYTNRIMVDQVEYKKTVNGVNVVVYDKITSKVIDSFGIDSDDTYNVVR